jgi:Tfp pilus assembly major pilin PilA
MSMTKTFGVVLFIAAYLAAIAGSSAHEHHQKNDSEQGKATQAQEAKAAAAHALKAQQDCYRRCDSQREFCEEALTPAQTKVSVTYDCSQGRIECQKICPTFR